MTGMNHGPPALPVGRVIGGCRILQLLGRGGMGEVYLAEHLALQKNVALKILLPDMHTKEHVARFLKEARICSRIEHPNVVVIHDVGAQDGLHYIVMQYVQGKNLAELIWDRGGPLPWRSALRLIQLAAKGLHAVHQQGLVHRDIKPENIMLSVKLQVLLMDFGLVREEMDLSSVLSGYVMGTPAFMSPEQCQGQPLDRRSDIYSLGSTLYCLLTGKIPFQGETHREVFAQIVSGRQPPPIQQFNPLSPPQVSDLLRRLMSLSPEDRPPDALALAGELRALIRTEQLAETAAWEPSKAAAPSAPAASLPRLPSLELLPLETRSERWHERIPWLLGGSLIVACLLSLVLIASNLRRGGEERKRPDPPSRPGMVYIEDGFARLGDDETKLRKFLSGYMMESQLKQAMEVFRQEPPQRTRVPAFWIDQYEVTNAEYARFIQKSNRQPPRHWNGKSPPLGKEDHPIVNISYDDAEAYARWAGKKLPTREQWMRAFRGDNDWLFPWGDGYQAGQANVGDNPKYASTSPVQDTPQDVSPFKVYNLVGNASEFLRGVASYHGKPCRVGKGSEYKMPGFFFGIGSCQFCYGLTTAEAGVGFRCVCEEP
jgi:serine/threonine protein kinase